MLKKLSFNCFNSIRICTILFFSVKIYHNVMYYLTFDFKTPKINNKN